MRHLLLGGTAHVRLRRLDEAERRSAVHVEHHIPLLGRHLAEGQCGKDSQPFLHTAFHLAIEGHRILHTCCVQKLKPSMAFHGNLHTIWEFV